MTDQEKQIARRQNQTVRFARILTMALLTQIGLHGFDSLDSWRTWLVLVLIPALEVAYRAIYPADDEVLLR